VDQTETGCEGVDIIQWRDLVNAPSAETVLTSNFWMFGNEFTPVSLNLQEQNRMVGTFVFLEIKLLFKFMGSESLVT
jgi:hypothetical protein